MLLSSCRAANSRLTPNSTVSDLNSSSALVARRAASDATERGSNNSAANAFARCSTVRGIFPSITSASGSAPIRSIRRWHISCDCPLDALPSFNLCFSFFLLTQTIGPCLGPQHATASRTCDPRSSKTNFTPHFVRTVSGSIRAFNGTPSWSRSQLAKNRILDHKVWHQSPQTSNANALRDNASSAGVAYLPVVRSDEADKNGQRAYFKNPPS